MIKNFITITFRNIVNQKVFTLVNVLGLAIGMACSIVISLYILNETSYDRFFDKSDRIYRVGIKGHVRGNDIHQAITAAPMASVLSGEYNQILKTTRYAKLGSWLVTYQNKKYNEEGVVFTDSAFFDIFSFEIIYGKRSELLSKPRSLVFTQSVAKKYFGDSNPVGKKIKLENDSTLYTVTGVIQDIPTNCHFNFDIVGSLSSFKKLQQESWLLHNLYTYILIEENTDPDALTKDINRLVDKYVFPEIRKILGMNKEQFYKSGNSFMYFLQPITKIHLYSDVQSEPGKNEKAIYVYSFGVVAILILVIACMNFINLTTANSTNRAKEVMLRKVLGSNRKLLMAQFLTESVIFSFISLLIALVLAELLIPVFNQFLKIDLQLNFFGNIPTILAIVCFTFIIGIVAGIYPAVFISRFKPTAVLHGFLGKGIKTSKVRSTFVILQFFVSILMITLTFIIFGQVRFMLKKDLGFYKDHVVVIRRPDALNDKLGDFENEIGKLKHVISTTHSNSIPGSPFNKYSFITEGLNEEEALLFNQVWVNYDYLDAYGLELVQGRFFHPDSASDENAMVINEKAASFLGADNPIGMMLKQPKVFKDTMIEYKIIGVIKDFHFQTVDHEIEPLVINIMSKVWGGFINVRIEPENTAATINNIEKVWRKYSPDYPFNYFSLNDNYNLNYESIITTGRIFLIFSLLAVFVACLGLFGLVTFTSNLRTREIGIRKALGATVPRILLLYIRESVQLILYSTVFAWIAALFISKWWLAGFYFHTKIYPLYFILSTVIVSLIAISTVSYQAIRAARLNPGEALKYE